jgi:DNA-binding LacI/PurR family transcriptional regulator
MTEAQRRRRLTIADLAASTGLSKSTISRAINDRERIAPETRLRVLAALAAAGYVPNRAATNLSTGRTRLIALMIGQNRDPTALTVMQGALAAAVPAHYGVVVYITASEAEHEALYWEMAATGAVDGALLLHPSARDEAFVRRVASQMPVVLIEPQIAMTPLPTVEADAYRDGAQSADHLIAAGHTRIALCADEAAWPSQTQYMEGYRDALVRAGIPFDPVLGVHAGWTYEVGYEVAERWMRLEQPPTAMCFCCDTAALGAMAAIRDAERSIPEDVAIVGYDDTVMATWTRPALTTPAQRRFGLVQKACELLIEIIDGADPPARPVLVPTGLTVRASTAA